MKKFLLLAVSGLLFLTTDAFAQAQLSYGAPPPVPDSGDFVNNYGPLHTTGVYTVTNTGADTAHAFIAPGINNYMFQSLTFQADITKVSGTAGGTVTLYGSTDLYGSVFFAPIATYSITTASSQCWNSKVVGNPYTSYWVVITGTGTEVLNVLFSLLER